MIFPVSTSKIGFKGKDELGLEITKTQRLTCFAHPGPVDKLFHHWNGNFMIKHTSYSDAFRACTVVGILIEGEKPTAGARQNTEAAKLKSLRQENPIPCI
ncbi:hypothetical protein [Terasakiella sp. SH-1]|uniref:hypothetical protein n=1 Tax=Terasakiella sp. SH-1 TaxID=2560057 RepID=UPI00107423A0|nr:hypothetical protein [Terasakiella sp. SH-1]